ncbi:MAG: DUF1330 domain-containing protein [Pseudomonadota bacterium]
MAKGYVIARIDVTDEAEYAKYTAETPRLVAEAGGRFLARGGRHEALEGAARTRNVIIEFPDYETARAFYDSPGYRAILPHALAGSAREMVVVEGA